MTMQIYEVDTIGLRSVWDKPRPKYEPHPYFDGMPVDNDPFGFIENGIEEDLGGDDGKD